MRENLFQKATIFKPGEFFPFQYICSTFQLDNLSKEIWLREGKKVETRPELFSSPTNETWKFVFHLQIGTSVTYTPFGFLFFFCLILVLFFPPQKPVRENEAWNTKKFRLDPVLMVCAWWEQKSAISHLYTCTVLFCCFEKSCSFC